MSNEFGENVKRLRIAAGYGQYEFAKMVGISPASLSSYENGRKKPQMDGLLTMAEQLGVSLDILCGRSVGCEFFNMSDIIRSMLKLDSLGLFEADVVLEEDEDSADRGVSIRLSGKNRGSDSLDYVELLGKFIKERNNLMEQLSSISDKSVREELYSLWLEKQLDVFESIPVVNND